MVEPVVRTRIPDEIADSQFQKCHARTEPTLLKMHEGPCQLDKSFVEEVISLSAAREPEFLEHIVRFVIQAGVEAIEIAQIVRIVTAGVGSKSLNTFGDARSLLAHARWGSIRAHAGPLLSHTFGLTEDHDGVVAVRARENRARRSGEEGRWVHR